MIGIKVSILILFEVRLNASWEGLFNEVGGVCVTLDNVPSRPSLINSFVFARLLFIPAEAQ